MLAKRLMHVGRADCAEMGDCKHLAQVNMEMRGFLSDV